MVKITNHTKRAISLLASQFREEKADGSPTNFQKMIKCFTDELQEAEDTNLQLKEERWLENAIGKQLDEIGKILGLPRAPDESDDDYRERLEFQIFINSSKGTPEDIIETAKILTESTEVQYFERDYAFFELGINGTKLPDPPNDLNEAIKQVSPAGVNYTPITATYGAAIPFELVDGVSDVYVPNDPFAPTETGGLEELGYPLATAGQIGELIQKGGNLPTL